MKPVSSSRAATITAAAFAGCAIAAMGIGPAHPVLSLGACLAVSGAAAVALPAPGVVWAARLAGKALRAARAWTPWPAEPDPQAARAAQEAWARAWREQEAPECTAHRGMCACGIEAHHWERFEAEMEVLASMLWPRERRRGQ